jgi:hypothetical protein
MNVIRNLAGLSKRELRRWRACISCINIGDAGAVPDGPESRMAGDGKPVVHDHCPATIKI